jgi:hypothetical protein
MDVENPAANRQRLMALAGMYGKDFDLTHALEQVGGHQELKD